MNRRGFFRTCLAAVGAMLLPAVKAWDVEPPNVFRVRIWNSWGTPPPTGWRTVAFDLDPGSAWAKFAPVVHEVKT